MSGPRRLTGIELPKPIIAINNAFDAWEKAKKARTRAGDKVKDTEAALIAAMHRHKGKLKKIAGDGLLYNCVGYRITLTSAEKVSGTHSEDKA